MEINYPLIITLIAMLTSYGRWLYLSEKLWKLIERDEKILYKKLGKPNAQQLYFGKPIVKFLFSKELGKIKNTKLKSFCKKMRAFFFFHTLFSFFCVIAFLYFALASR